MLFLYNTLHPHSWLIAHESTCWWGFSGIFYYYFGLICGHVSVTLVSVRVWKPAFLKTRKELPTKHWTFVQMLKIPGSVLESQYIYWNTWVQFWGICSWVFPFYATLYSTTCIWQLYLLSKLRSSNPRFNLNFDF